MKTKILIISIIFFSLLNTVSAGELKKGQCPENWILHQNLKAPNPGEPYVRNGRYHWYTKGIVKEANILQKHLNRLEFNAGTIDGIIGPKTRGAILRLQKYLGTKQDGYIGPQTRALLNDSCGEGSGSVNDADYNDVSKEKEESLNGQNHHKPNINKEDKNKNPDYKKTKDLISQRYDKKGKNGKGDVMSQIAKFLSKGKSGCNNTNGSGAGVNIPGYGGTTPASDPNAKNTGSADDKKIGEKKDDTKTDNKTGDTKTDDKKDEDTKSDNSVPKFHTQEEWEVALKQIDSLWTNYFSDEKNKQSFGDDTLINSSVVQKSLVELNSWGMIKLPEEGTKACTEEGKKLTEKYWKAAGYPYSGCVDKIKDIASTNAAFISHVTNGELKGDRNIFFLLKAIKNQLKWKVIWHPEVIKGGDIYCRRIFVRVNENRVGKKYICEVEYANSHDGESLKSIVYDDKEGMVYIGLAKTGLNNWNPSSRYILLRKK